MAEHEQLESLLQDTDIVDVRLICFKVQAGWRVKRLYATLGLTHPDVPNRLEYPEHLFLHFLVPAQDFLLFLQEMQSENTHVALQQVDLIHQRLALSSVQHSPGYQHWGLTTSAIPTWHFGGTWVSATNPMEYERTDIPLVGLNGAPYFPRVVDGEAWYLSGKGVQRHGDNLPTVEIALQDPRAYFTGVEITGNTYTVHCAGTMLSQCQLQLYTSLPQIAQTLAAAQNSFIIEGEPDVISLALTHEVKWLDRRDVNAAAMAGWNADDVRRTDMVDRELSIKELINRHGENLTLEFKANAGEQGKPTLSNRFLQTVVAFANTVGGTILLGVNDDGEIEGLGALDTKERIQNMIETSISPVPNVENVRQEVDGKVISLIHVAQGTQKPYALVTSSTKHTFYVRRDGSTRQARPEDIRAMMTELVAQNSRSNPLSGYSAL